MRPFITYVFFHTVKWVLNLVIILLLLSLHFFAIFFCKEGFDGQLWFIFLVFFFIFLIVFWSIVRSFDHNLKKKLFEFWWWELFIFTLLNSSKSQIHFIFFFLHSALVFLIRTQTCMCVCVCARKLILNTISQLSRSFLSNIAKVINKT